LVAERGGGVTIEPYQPEDSPSPRTVAIAKQLQGLIRRVVLEGVGPLENSVDYANDRLERARRSGLSGDEAREAAINKIVRESLRNAGLTGFTTGLGDG
jgi:hypothetical protein